MADNKMTERDFLKAVIGAAVADEVKEYAENALAKMDAKNEKRRNTPTKAQEANKELSESIVAMLKENAKGADNAMTAAAIGAEMGISTQKASSLATKLVNDGFALATEVKEKGKGKVKGYYIA